ncbi:MAG: YgiQ family radical SAM protein, partial [Clostridia bacterium]
PSFEQVSTDKPTYARAFLRQMQEQDALRGKKLMQSQGNRYVLQNPPSPPLTRQELDAVYALPYLRAWHPCYDALGGVPALAEVQFSIAATRGCFGGCNFCALTYHQGRVVSSRSPQSILVEAEKLTHLPGFKGYIHDVGGPTANFRRPACDRQATRGACAHRQCLFPQPCKQLIVDHSEFLSILRSMRSLPGVKKVFIRSGLRYDYILADSNADVLREICAHHVSGQLKVAPEHVSPRVLACMGKPGREVYDQFVRKYEATNRQLGMQQYLVPYLMSSHPGSDLPAAIELAEYLRDIGHAPEQVQDFYPTPGTLSTAMFYTGLDPRTMQPVYVARTAHEKALQRALLQYRNPKNYALVGEALRLAGREDLIGFDSPCLLRPRVTPSRTSRPAAPSRSRSTAKPTAKPAKPKRIPKPGRIGTKPPKLGLKDRSK